MAQRLITGTIYKSDGTPWVGGLVLFTLMKAFVEDNVVYPENVVTVTLDSQGQFSENISVPTTPTTAFYVVTLPDGKKYSTYLTSGAATDLQTIITVEGTEVDADDLQILLSANTLTTGALKIHRITDFTFPSPNVWTDIEFELKIESESTDAFGYYDEGLVTEDTSIIVSSVTGVFIMGGCIHPEWLGNVNGIPTLAIRVVSSTDSGSTWVEKRCLQVLTQKSRGIAEYDTQHYFGSINVVPNEQIKLQVYVSDVNLILAGAAGVFDNPISASMTLYGAY